MKTQYFEKNMYGTFYYSDKKMTKLHREYGPAVEWAHGTKEWFLNNVYHREDGPAIERSNGDKFWHLNGKLHREDGPAIERADGTKIWYLNGKRHREDGPAVELANGNKSWYLNHERLSKSEFIQRTTKIELTFDEIAAKLGVDPKNLKIKK